MDEYIQNHHHAENNEERPKDICPDLYALPQGSMRLFRDKQKENAINKEHEKQKQETPEKSSAAGFLMHCITRHGFQP